MEILDAYNSTRLVISGNSSHLVPWHAKLGFQMAPCISTLHHLNGDGGFVAVMAITVTKVSYT
jgi:breast cancer 2 susceptibility protein